MRTRSSFCNQTNAISLTPENVIIIVTSYSEIYDGLSTQWLFLVSTPLTYVPFLRHYYNVSLICIYQTCTHSLLALDQTLCNPLQADKGTCAGECPELVFLYYFQAYICIIPKRSRITISYNI